MRTFYEQRNSTANHAKVTRNVRQANMARNGLIMLHRNNNYSNTMRPCVYICARDKIQWM